VLVVTAARYSPGACRPATSTGQLRRPSNLTVRLLLAPFNMCSRWLPVAFMPVRRDDRWRRGFWREPRSSVRQGTLARSGGTVRLLAMHPDGSALVPSATTSGVDPVLRRGKIVQNLELLRKEFAQLAPDVRARVRLMVSDLALPVGAVGIDEGARGGSLIVQHYLTGTAAELAPLLWLHAESDEPWYGRYLAQCEACVVAARAWNGSGGRS
jgi:hypothetical protein